MFYAEYDDNGNVTGFYNPLLAERYGGIPTNVISITTEQHAEFFARGQRHKVQKQNDGSMAFVYIEPIITIEELRETKWRKIKDERDRLEQTGAPYMGKTLDCDEKSVQRITVAVQAAQAAISANVEFSLDWTMQDNSVITMTAAQVCGMSVALAQHSNGLHKTARELREKIEAAKTETDLSLIVWPE